MNDTVTQLLVQIVLSSFKGITVHARNANREAVALEKWHVSKLTMLFEDNSPEAIRAYLDITSVEYIDRASRIGGEFDSGSLDRLLAIRKSLLSLMQK